MGAFGPAIFDGGTFYSLFSDCLVGLVMMAFGVTMATFFAVTSRLWDAHTARKRSKQREAARLTQGSPT